MKLRTKLIIQFVLVLLVYSLITAYILSSDLKDYIVEQKLSSDINLGLSLLEIKYPGDWRLENNQLYKGETVLNNDYLIVDTVKDSTDSLATIFMLDKNNQYIQDEDNPYVRISTNVPQDNNNTQTNPDEMQLNRAIGTKLCQSVKDVINQDQEYVGEADILGLSYLTRYVPLKNKEGEIIGIWFVGVPDEYVYQQMIPFLKDLRVLCFIGLFIGGVLAYLLTKRFIREINLLKDNLHKVENGDYTVSFKVKSKDEIGSLQKSLSRVLQSIRNRAEIAEQITSGEENITVEVYSEQDILGKSLQSILENNQKLLQEIKSLTQEVTLGNLEYRANENYFQGQWKALVHGLNILVEKSEQPLIETSAVLAELANGNLSMRITEDYQGDHAKIKNSLNSMGIILQNYIEDLAKVLHEIARKNLAVSIDKEYLGDFSQLKQSINLIVQQMNDILKGISDSTNQVDAASQQIASSSQLLSQGAVTQAEVMHTLAAEINEVQVKAETSNTKAHQVYQITTTTKENVLNGDEQIKRMQESMQAISDASQNIAKIIKTIESIASQTNLLALNASVEAARAGQMGQGFAVVAEEVRSLANQSAKAARETAEIVMSAIDLIQEGSHHTKSTAEEFKAIVTGIETTSHLVKEITKLSEEQAMIISGMHRRIDQVAQVVDATSATAEELAASSEEMSAQALTLNKSIKAFTFKKKPAHKLEIIGE